VYCTNCGLQNSDTATVCSGCGASLVNPYQASPGATGYSPPTGYSPTIPSYLAQSILVTIFCCVPFGIVAIVYAARVSSLLAAGDYQGALEASSKAKMWCWIAFLPGLISMVISIIAALSGHGEVFFHVHRPLR
jgi:hypothetical protein